MKAAVRHFISPDVDLDDFHPEDPDDFSFLLQALIGPADSLGEESFQFTVVTPRALQKMVEADGVVLGRSFVIVEGPDLGRLLTFMRTAIGRPDASNWAELAQKLARIGVYEFEDYS